MIVELGDIMFLFKKRASSRAPTRDLQPLHKDALEQRLEIPGQARNDEIGFNIANSHPFCIASDSFSKFLCHLARDPLGKLTLNITSGKITDAENCIFSACSVKIRHTRIL